MKQSFHDLYMTFTHGEYIIDNSASVYIIIMFLFVQVCIYNRCVCMFIYLNDRVIIYANHCHVALSMVG